MQFLENFSSLSNCRFHFTVELSAVELSSCTVELSTVEMSTVELSGSQINMVLVIRQGDIVEQLSKHTKMRCHRKTQI